MTDSEQKSDTLPQRLCSEVQLFDLCDLDSCTHKNGRFCTDSVLLRRFEKITEDELRTPDRYVSEDIDDDETAGAYSDDEDNELVMDDFDSGEDDGYDDEE